MSLQDSGKVLQSLFGSSDHLTIQFANFWYLHKAHSSHTHLKNINGSVTEALSVCPYKLTKHSESNDEKYSYVKAWKSTEGYSQKPHRLVKRVLMKEKATWKIQLCNNFQKETKKGDQQEISQTFRFEWAEAIHALR